MDIYAYANTHQISFNQMPGFLILSTLDHKIALVSEKVAGLLGFESSCDVVGKSFYDVKSKTSEDAEVFEKQNKLVFTCSKKIVTLGYHYYIEDWRLNLSEKHPLINNNGIIIGVMTNWMDITNYNLVDLSRFIYGSSKQFNQVKEKSFSYVIEDGSINSYKLSQRQIECLFFLLRGKSDKEISNILGLSPRTVESYINEIKFKMNCLTRSQLIEKSFNEGLTNLIPENFIK